MTKVISVLIVVGLIGFAGYQLYHVVKIFIDKKKNKQQKIDSVDNQKS